MRVGEALVRVGEVAGGQWGLVTTAQAAAVGVPRLVLARAVAAGHLVRLTQGVYRQAGVPAEELEELRAGWLAADPGRTAEVRVAEDPTAVVVAGATAAWLHRVGDLPPQPYRFTTRTRRQTQRAGLRFRTQALDPAQVSLVAGLPTTTVERTLADLVAESVELSLVADALADAARTGSVDRAALAELLGPLAARHGHARGDGQALLEQLLEIAGLDAASVAEQVAASGLGPLVTARYLRHLLAHYRMQASTPELERRLRNR